MLGGGDDRGLGIHRHARGGGEFLAVRHHHVGAGIAGEIAAAGIDDQLAAGLARGFHQLGRHIGRQHALAVVRQHGDAGRRHRIQRDAHQAFGQLWVDRVGLLAVRAQQLLAGGDQAGLQRGGAAALDQQPGLHVRLAADQPGEVGPGLVVADDGDERGCRTQRGQVAHHVAGAAGQRDFPLDGQDRHRRFQADPGHVAVGVAVEHDVADDQYVGMGQAPDRGREIRLRLIRARSGAGGNLVHSTCRSRGVGNAATHLRVLQCEQARRMHVRRLASSQLCRKPSLSSSRTTQVSAPPSTAPVSMAMRLGWTIGSRFGVWPCTTTAP